MWRESRNSWNETKQKEPILDIGCTRATVCLSPSFLIPIAQLFFRLMDI